ncbi:hypothetical protein AKJ16_DCAP16582, partial [Drosera capensis]
MDKLLVIMYLHIIRPDLDSVKSSILGSPAIPSLTEKSRSTLLFSLHLVMAEGDPLRPVKEEHLPQAEAGNPTRAVDVGARNVSIVANLGIGRTPAMILSDSKTKAMIGTGRESYGGHYILISSPIALTTSGDVLRTHCQLGHPGLP